MQDSEMSEYMKKVPLRFAIKIIHLNRHVHSHTTGLLALQDVPTIWQAAHNKHETSLSNQKMHSFIDTYSRSLPRETNRNQKRIHFITISLQTIKITLFLPSWDTLQTYTLSHKLEIRNYITTHNQNHLISAFFPNYNFPNKKIFRHTL